MKKEILGFFNEYRFLSNYALVTIEYESLIFKSTEHAYQASKTLDMNERVKIRDCFTCREARRAGQSITFRPDWDEVKIQVMLDVNRLKYQYPIYRDLLLATGDAYLEETNTWGDVYWGVCQGVGHNNLGKVLMQIRDEIRT